MKLLSFEKSETEGAKPPEHPPMGPQGESGATAITGGAVPTRGAAAPAPLLAPALLTSDALFALDIPPRPALMGEWFKAGDYGVIFGKRGLGKSWLALGLACALAQGRSFGPWECTSPRRVLYVDGEMALDDYRSRVDMLLENGGNHDNNNSGGDNSGGDNNGGDLMHLSHQAVFNQTGKALCLSERAQQDELTRLCEAQCVDVLFLDNGACLFRDVAENDADDFRDKIEGWLLDLRRRGIAVALVLHAGRNGAIRGTSKREDAAFWILRLDEPHGGHSGHEAPGARFLTRFAKNRNAAQDPPPLDWHFHPVGNAGSMGSAENMGSKTLVTYREADNMALLRQWVQDGLASCSEIAEEMGLSKGQVSKLATRAIKEGWLAKRGKTYAIVEP